MNKNMVSENTRILMMQLPFWAPLIPPQGIARLKTYLNINGYKNVVTIDANVETQFKNIYEDYFNHAKEYIPDELHGNFYDNGHDVFRLHLMAHLNCKVEKDYIHLAGLLFDSIYLYIPSNQEILTLNKIIDSFYTKLETYFLSLMKEYDPEIIGFSLHSGNFPATIFLSELVRKIRPDTKIILGGSMFAGELRQETPDFDMFIKRTGNLFDKIFIGLSERALYKYLRGELPEDKKVICQEDLNEKIMTINSFVKPDLSDFDLSKYSTIASYTSLSCTNECSFCNEKSFWGEYQKRDLSLAVNEIVKSYEEYKPGYFFMLDVMLNHTIDDFSKAIIETKLPIYYDGYLRVSEDSCDYEKCMTWRQGGLYRVRMGLESGSQKLLDVMKKGITVEQSTKTLHNLAKVGIKTTGYFVIGHPGETEEDFIKTLNFIEESKDNFWQIEPHVFNYMHTGQNSGDIWSENRSLIYPEKYNEHLICTRWKIDLEPNRNTVFERLLRFVKHCDKLGIKNPYYSYEKYNADLRWKRLHKNAVPSTLELDSHNFTDTVRGIEDRIEAAIIKDDSNGDFAF